MGLEVQGKRLVPLFPYKNVLYSLADLRPLEPFFPPLTAFFPRGSGALMQRSIRKSPFTLKNGFVAAISFDSVISPFQPPWRPRERFETSFPRSTALGNLCTNSSKTRLQVRSAASPTSMCAVMVLSAFMNDSEYLMSSFVKCGFTSGGVSSTWRPEGVEWRTILADQEMDIFVLSFSTIVKMFKENKISNLLPNFVLDVVIIRQHGKLRVRKRQFNTAP